MPYVSLINLNFSCYCYGIVLHKLRNEIRQASVVLTVSSTLFLFMLNIVSLFIIIVGNNLRVLDMKVYCKSDIFCGKENT